MELEVVDLVEYHFCMGLLLVYLSRLLLYVAIIFVLLPKLVIC